MSYDPGALEAALNAAIGNDQALIGELRAVFLESAERQLDLMSRARCDANWEIAAWRMKGLAASFGVTGLMRLAEEASNAVPGDPVILRQIRAAIDALRT
ncbi:MAG: Hpt domain-containing protein [Sphingobium sp.]|nr:Hpt domain-containing protein [Sphingobium sp.]